MRLMATAAGGAAVFLLVMRGAAVRLADRVEIYLLPARTQPAESSQGGPPPLAGAGILWTNPEVRLRRAAATLAGTLVGLMLAQGDLFLAGTSRSAPGLAVLGGLGGAVGFQVWVTQRTERRSRQLQAELPVVADLIALRVLAGESVAAALEHVVEGTSGVAAEEFGGVLTRYRSGKGLAEALQAQVGITVASEAGRLYGFLANAHQSGGRLAEALLGLATDYRAEQERDLRVEGGKRALAVYAPILALMIPVALMFLMYPTLAGLSELSTTP
jgi:tight adherence protein C